MTTNQLPPLPPASVDEHNLQGGRLLYTRQTNARVCTAALAQQAQEPVAWLVSLPDEPELGEWFSEQDMSEQGYTSKPLYTTPQPQPAPPVPAPVDEREAFQASMRTKHGWEDRDFKSDSFGYFDGHTATAWLAWQARAALQSPAPQTKGGEA